MSDDRLEGCVVHSLKERFCVQVEEWLGRGFELFEQAGWRSSVIVVFESVFFRFDHRNSLGFGGDQFRDVIEIVESAAVGTWSVEVMAATRCRPNFLLSRRICSKVSSCGHFG